MGPGRGAGCGPKVLVGVGPLFMLVGVALFGYAVFTGGSSAAESIGDFANLRDDIVIEVDPPGSAETVLDEGEYSIIAFGDGLVVEDSQGETTAVDFDQPSLRVTGPDGELDLDSGFLATSTLSAFDAEGVGLATFTVDDAGRHTFEVGEADVLVDSVSLSEGTLASDATDALVDLGPAAVWGVLGAASFGFGLLVLVIGVVWWVVAARRGKGSGFGGGSPFGRMGGFSGGKGGFGIQGRPWGP